MIVIAEATISSTVAKISSAALRTALQLGKKPVRTPLKLLIDTVHSMIESLYYRRSTFHINRSRNPVVQDNIAQCAL